MSSMGRLYNGSVRPHGRRRPGRSSLVRGYIYGTHHWTRPIQHCPNLLADVGMIPDFIACYAIGLGDLSDVG